MNTKNTEKNRQLFSVMTAFMLTVSVALTSFNGTVQVMADTNQVDSQNQEDTNEQNIAESGEETSDSDDSNQNIPEDIDDTYGIAGELEETVGNAAIQVTYDKNAGLPEKTELVVQEIPKEEETEYADAAREVLKTDRIAAQYYYDIHFEYEDHEIEPQDNVEVQITLSGEDRLKDEDDVQVLHFPDQDNASEPPAPELMETTVEHGTDSVITFQTDRFSVYGITDSESKTSPETDSTKFIFHYEDGSVDTQYVKDGEVLNDPGTPSGSKVSEEHQKDVEFLGWYQKDGDSWGEKQTFGSFTNPDATKKTIDLYPRYEKRAYIYYYDESLKNVYAISKAAPGDTVYTQDPGKNVPDGSLPFMTYMSGASDKVFVGWSKTQNASVPDSNITIGSGQSVIHLYPVVQQAKWLTFMSGPKDDSSASYFASEPILNGTWTRTALDDRVPTRDGYTFDGWYVRNEVSQGDDDQLDYSWKIGSSDIQVTDASGNLVQAFMENPSYFSDGSLLQNLTLVAHWTPANTSYTVIYWLQNPDGSGYSYAGSKVEAGTAGQMTSYKPNPDDIGSSASAFQDANGNSILPYLTLHTSSTSDPYTFKQAVIHADGSTRLNVYYDRKTYTLRFYYGYKSGNNYFVYSETGKYSNAPENNSVSQALQAQGSSNAQQVTSFPKLLNQYASTGETAVGSSTYYYFDVQAKYGQDISSMWPEQPFENNSVTKTKGGTLEFVSWATRNGSGYYKNNSNKNIKGPYSILDSNLIMNPESIDGMAQSFLAYWSNASTYRYEVYYSLLDGEKADINYKGSGYKLHDSYDVGSTATWDQQSASALKGMSLVPGSNGKTGTPISHDGQDNKGKGGTVRFAYQRNPHTITFYTTTNTGSDARIGTDENIPYGEDISKENIVARYEKEAKALAPKGYQFAGWYESAATAESLHRNDLEEEDRRALKEEQFQFTGTMPDYDLALYAAYEPIQYLVALDFNGGVTDESELTYFWVPYGGKIQEDDDVTRNYRKATSTDPADAQRYEYIQYKYQPSDNGEGYSYYIDDNGTRHNTDNQEKRSANYQASSSGNYVYQKNAYQFVGWYETDANGNRLSQVSYDFSNNVTHDTYLKAVWKNPGVFKVHYLADDETDHVKGNAETKPEDQIYTYTDLSRAIAARAMEPADDGYLFDGWRVAKDPSGIIYQPGQVVPIESDYSRRDSDGTQYIDLEPVFRKKGTTSILYNINPPEGTQVSDELLKFFADKEQKNIPLNSTVTLSNDRLSDGSRVTLEENHFILVGWCSKPSTTDEGAIEYKPGGNYGISDSDGLGKDGTTNTLYAVWGQRFNIQNVDRSHPDRKLSGAVFKLTKTENSSDKPANVTANDFYEDVQVPADGYTAAAGDDGSMQIPALKPGRYTLTEIKAPDGYSRIPAFSFQVNGNGTISFTTTEEVTYNGNTEDGSSDPAFTFVVKTAKAINLPHTGKAGISVAILMGWLCILVSMIFYMRRKTEH